MKIITRENIHDLQDYLEQEGYTFIVYAGVQNYEIDYIADYSLRWVAKCYKINEPCFDITVRECDGKHLPYIVGVLHSVSRIEIERKK